MPTFAAAATGAIILCTVLMLIVFRRFKLLNLATLAAVTIASLVTIAAFPLLFGLIARFTAGTPGTSALLLVSLLTLAAFPVLAFLLSVLITAIIPNPVKKAVHAGAGSLGSENAVEEETSSTIENANYLEQIYDKLVNENSGEIKSDASKKYFLLNEHFI